MTRRKIRLAWIENETARKASFKKRRAGLLKKMKELTTLCGVSAFIIINGPGESGPPAIWPSVEEARELYQRFRSVPDVERCKKMVNQESYLRERSGKMAEQIRRQHRQNIENMTSYIIAQIFGHGRAVTEFEPNEVNIVVWVMNDKLKELKTKIQFYDQTVGNQPPGSSSNLPPPLIPNEDIVMTPAPIKENRPPWESFFSGILNNIHTTTNNNNIINVVKANNNNNNNNNHLIINNVVTGVDQGPSVGMQVPDRGQYFVGGTSNGSTSLNVVANNVVYPNYYGAGSSSSGTATTGNVHGFQAHPYVMNNQNLFCHAGGSNINAISNDQMGLVNVGQFGSGTGRGNPIIINGGRANNMGFAPYRQQEVMNLGGSGTTTQPNTNLGHINLGLGGVNNNFENVGFGVQSGQGDIMMAENYNNGSFATNVTRNDIAAGKRPWFGADSGNSAGNDSCLFDFNKNWPGPSN
ncbi:MADS-box transcription factor PHERES 2-like [Humulus lupulus]|uniref:MADS-box transcription factor PHERES 2-like n=1 Tax=Humulus lupulus TaxID=3486 RepID=UPI002B40B508|nr:MADS-box transcription factor PHERES 2-like [Humulus lupulus]